MENEKPEFARKKNHWEVERMKGGIKKPAERSRKKKKRIPRKKIPKVRKYF